MSLTPEELKNITVLCEIGAKALSNEKSLQESANIQAIALKLLEKLQSMCQSPKSDKPVPKKMEQKPKAPVIR